MASLLIRNLDDLLKARLRVQAAHNGQSMEEEARQILRKALFPVPAPSEDQVSGDLADRLRRRFASLVGADLND
jgi:plasmid stability protein